MSPLESSARLLAVAWLAQQRHPDEGPAEVLAYVDQQEPVAGMERTGTPEGDTVGLVLDYSCIDLGVQVTDSQAFETARYIARNMALLGGGSTGGAIFKALELIHKGVITGNVVVPIADGGEKFVKKVVVD